MKLLNEDNPFENPAPTIKKDTLSAFMLQDSAEAVSKEDRQIMSFGGDDSTIKNSIADKTTERESKNTNRTGGFGVSSSGGAAASGAQFTFSK